MAADELVRARVQKRVQERNQWLVHGAPPTTPKTLGLTQWEVLKEIIRYQPPSQAELDRVFPLVSPMDWRQLIRNQSCGATATTTTTLSSDDHHQTNDIRLTWLGHSSILVQMGDHCNILTDPVFSQRASPFQWAGPKRYRPPPCQLTELLDNIRIDAVLISHNHYDHLDYHTVCELARRNTQTQFIVPLGLARWFNDYVVPGGNETTTTTTSTTTNQRVVELDWHESVQLKMNHDIHHHQNNNVSVISGPQSSTPVVTITGLPARHWSNRIGNVDQSLWCGYSVVVQPMSHHNNHSSTNHHSPPRSSTSSSSFYFAGDTAWWDDVVEIGRQYGPFDVAALPIGAYHPWEFMKANHVNVEEAVMMKDAVQAKYAVPIHWGTFPLTVEPVMEPREKLVNLMADRADRDSFTTWRIGETKRFAPSTTTSTTSTTTSPMP
jgi:N-acyl-phosphatidylethanolamine-hydrolysing phospholipase D